MPLDASNAEKGRYLIRRLPEFNPWWEEGVSASATDQFVSLRSDFYAFHHSLLTSDNQLFGIVGPDGVGKTTLLKQVLSALIDTDFVEKFYRQPGFREEARRAVVAPSDVLYIPFAEDPLFQLRSGRQLQAAVEHFETRIQRQNSDSSSTRYIVLDDVNSVGSAGTDGQWLEALAELVQEDHKRRIILTGVTGSQLVPAVDAAGSSSEARLPPIRSMLPMKFMDFARFRFRQLETTASKDRFSTSRARQALYDAVDQGDPQLAVEKLNAEANNAMVSGSDLRREIPKYFTVGGFLGLRLASVGCLSTDDFDSILRNRGPLDFTTLQEESLSSFRHTLRERGPEIESIADPAGLERLCALTAAEKPVSSVQYNELSELLDVDRRTLRDKYFSALSTLYVLTPSPEYDNLRPRTVRLYLRDPGIANAFARRDLNDVLAGRSEANDALAKLVVFDHTVRLSYNLNDHRDPKRGYVKFWSGSNGEVDFIPKIKGYPLPISWIGQQRLEDLADAPGNGSELDEVVEFLSSDAPSSERDAIDSTAFEPITDAEVTRRRDYVQHPSYGGVVSGDRVGDGDPPFGVVLTTSRIDDSRPVTLHHTSGTDAPILELPLWLYLRLV